MTRRDLLLVVLAVVAIAAVSTTALARAGASSEEWCVRASTRAADRAELVSGTGPEVLVIGDSWSVGAGLDLDDSWPMRLPGRVRVDGFAGSGYSVGASGCGDVSFATRAESSARSGTGPVVVEGGLNDFDQPVAAIEDGFARLMATLGDRPVLVVGPPPAPRRPTPALATVDATLARLAAQHGASYLSMRGVELTYQPDRLHPDAAGQRRFGDLVRDEVARLGW